MNIEETITILNNRICTLNAQLSAAKSAGDLGAIPAIEADLAGTQQTITALKAATGG
jgi:hypothetical protein